MFYSGFKSKYDLLQDSGSKEIEKVEEESKLVSEVFNSQPVTALEDLYVPSFNLDYTSKRANKMVAKYIELMNKDVKTRNIK